MKLIGAGYSDDVQGMPLGQICYVIRTQGTTMPHRYRHLLGAVGAEIAGACLLDCSVEEVVVDQVASVLCALLCVLVATETVTSLQILILSIPPPSPTRVDERRLSLRLSGRPAAATTSRQSSPVARRWFIPFLEHLKRC